MKRAVEHDIIETARDKHSPCICCNNLVAVDRHTSCKSWCSKWADYQGKLAMQDAMERSRR